MNKFTLVLQADETSALELQLGQYLPTPATEAAASAAAAAASAAQALAVLSSSLLKANNLSDLVDVVAARASLGLGSAALQNVGVFAQVANNLSDLLSAATARTNLGLGTAAVQNVSAFAQTANNLSDIASAATALANIGGLAKASNLSDLANAATARGNLSAAKSGGNSDITSLAGLTTALSIAQGGTGGATAAAARTALGAAATGTDLSQFAATTSAQLAGVLSDETGTGSAVFGTGPTISSPVLNGRTSSTALGSGEIGYRTANVTAGPTGWSNNTWGAIVSITLQPGVWDLDGIVNTANSGNNLTNFAAAWSTVASSSAATFPEYVQFGGASLSVVNSPMPTKRVQVTVATTYYINVYTGFGAGTQTTQGACWATRRG